MNTLIGLIGGFVASIGGASDVFLKKAIEDIGELKTSFYLRIYTIVLFLPLLVLFWERFNLTVNHMIYLVSFSIIDVIALLVLFNAYKIGKVSIISPITASYGGVSAIYSYLFLGESFGSTKLIGIVLLILGIVFVSIDLKELRDGLQIRDLAKGLPQAIFILLLYGIATPVWGNFIDQTGWMVIVVVSLIIDLTLLGLIVFITWKSNKPIKSDMNHHKEFLLSSILLTTMFFGYNWAFRFSNEKTLIIALASTFPATVAIVSYFYLKEKLSINQYLGIGIIIVGVVLLALSTQVV